MEIAALPNCNEVVDGKKLVQHNEAGDVGYQYLRKFSLPIPLQAL
jgi:hypothetical protein